VIIGHIKVVEDIICFWYYHFHFQFFGYYWATLTHVNPPHLQIPKNFKTLHFHNFSKFLELKIVFGGAKAIPINDWRRSSNLETIGMENKLYIARFILCAIQWIPIMQGIFFVIIGVVTPNLTSWNVEGPLVLGHTRCLAIWFWDKPLCIIKIEKMATLMLWQYHLQPTAQVWTR
jgi:hypothetical protein